MVMGSPNDASYMKPDGVNKEIVTLKAMFNRAVNIGIITLSPLTLLKKVEVLSSRSVRYFTPDELELIYDTPHHYWWRLLANTGMRLGEARHLTWDHVGDDFIEIESTEEKATKSGKWRKVPIGPNVRKALLDFWREESGDPTAEQYPQNGGCIFPPFQPNSFVQAAKRDIKQAGLKGSAHKFRHTYISLLAMNDTSLEKLQVLAGHAKSATTKGYMHLSPEYLAGVAEHC